MNTCRTRWKGSGVSPGESTSWSWTIDQLEFDIDQLELDNTQYSRH